MKITGIERQKKNPRRYNIFIDDSFEIGVDRNVVADFGLRRGDAVTETVLSELRDADAKTTAYQKALRFLSYRTRSVQEIRNRLERDSIPPKIIEYTVVKLLNQQLLDDSRFAETFAESKMMHRPVGMNRLRRELLAKGISRTIVEKVLDTYSSPESEYLHALQIARKKLQTDRSVESRVRRRRLAGLLARRGYSWDVIGRVLETVEL